MVKIIKLNDNNRICITKKMFESYINIDYVDPINITSIRLGTLSDGKWEYPNIGSFNKLIQLSKQNGGIKYFIKRGQFEDVVDFDINLRWNCFKRRFNIQVHKLTKNIF
jgi:hypothetical protein